MKIINMTPHDIIVDNGEKREIYKASGTVARLKMGSETVDTIDGFKVVKNVVVGHNLPPEKKIKEEEVEEVKYLVSGMILNALNREDLVAPDTNQARRNEKGHIVSVPGFVC